MLARLCIIIFLFFSFTCAETIQQDKQEIKILEKYEGYSSHIQWFASLGVGGLYHSNLKSVFLDNYFAMGLIIPYSDRVSHYFSIDFDSVFLNDWYRKYVDTLGVSTSISNQILETIHYRSSGGYALDFSVNYNFGYSVFYTKGYRIEFFGGIGIGGQFEFLFLDIAGKKAREKNTSFLVNINLGMRNVFFENHAFDLMFRTGNLKELIFSFNYTFLKI